MKTALIFNDISGLGNCSMAANIAVLSAMGHYCVPVVTATYSCQTGFDRFTCQRNTHLAQSVADIASNATPDAAYIGFAVDAQLLPEAVQSVRKLGLPLFVDPILGDDGALYPVFDAAYVAEMKSAVNGAWCISPNLTEACLLCDVDAAELLSHSSEPTFLATCGQRLANLLQQTGARNAVVTGVPCGKLLGNIVLEQGQAVRYVTNEHGPHSYSGAGDVFSSVLWGSLLCGDNLLVATQKASSFVARAAGATTNPDGRFGLQFGGLLHLLRYPQ